MTNAKPMNANDNTGSAMFGASSRRMIRRLVAPHRCRRVDEVAF